MTRFGTSPTTSGDDLEVVNVDGQLLLTVGMGHFHEVAPWADDTLDRVTYAFDIIGVDSWRSDRVQVPFDLID